MLQNQLRRGKRVYYVSLANDKSSWHLNSSPLKLTVLSTAMMANENELGELQDALPWRVGIAGEFTPKRQRLTPAATDW